MDGSIIKIYTLVYGEVGLLNIQQRQRLPPTALDCISERHQRGVLRSMIDRFVRYIEPKARVLCVTKVAHFRSGG